MRAVKKSVSEIDREAAATLGALRVAVLYNGKPPKTKEARRSYHATKTAKIRGRWNPTSLVLCHSVKFLHLPRDVEAAVVSSKNVLKACVSEARRYCLPRLQVGALVRLVVAPPTSHGFKLTKKQVLEELDRCRVSESWSPLASNSYSRDLQDVLLENVELVSKLVSRIERPVFWKLPATALLAYFHVLDVRASASLGDARAQCTLAVMHEEGRAGQAKDRQTAAKLFAKAATHGDAFAQYGLALLFEGAASESVPKDEARALRLYALAAEQGLPEAQWKLGVLYEEGRAGLLKNDYKAVEWYRAAAERGCASAQFSLGMCYEAGIGGLRKSEHDALVWHRAAAAQSLPSALCYLGLAHEHGKAGLRQSDRKAAKLYRRAADRGCAPAALCLGLFHVKGRGGLAKDSQRAKELFRIAADNGAQLPLLRKRRTVSCEIPRGEPQYEDHGGSSSEHTLSSSVESFTTTTPSTATTSLLPARREVSWLVDEIGNATASETKAAFLLSSNAMMDSS